ncbi:hypothetical protein ES319_D05G033300v1 [Gossypium barbadense]|uniref:Uncharacterized protein n=1 Tax=Gossypium barbadense TaxID=3634 RepID=A0A5J5RFA2_GOSBA|nr:hypothetical protein ES319_D05G033300v1 [Gossypium barbadense]PPD89034.1 hypothetical protein GOBAR_DD14035 [Gossypium barbadense]
MKSGGNTGNCREDAAQIEDNKLTASGGRVTVKPKMKKTSKSLLAPMRTGWWGSLGRKDLQIINHNSHQGKPWCDDTINRQEIEPMETSWRRRHCNNQGTNFTKRREA